MRSATVPTEEAAESAPKTRYQQALVDPVEADLTHGAGATADLGVCVRDDRAADDSVLGTLSVVIGSAHQSTCIDRSALVAVHYQCTEYSTPLGEAWLQGTVRRHHCANVRGINQPASFEVSPDIVQELDTA